MKHSNWLKSGSYSFVTSLYAQNRFNDPIMAQNGFTTYIQTVLGHLCSRITQWEKTSTSYVGAILNIWDKCHFGGRGNQNGHYFPTNNPRDMNYDSNYCVLKTLFIHCMKYAKLGQELRHQR